MTSSERFERWKRWLRRRFPLRLPCTIALVPLAELARHGSDEGLCVGIYDDAGKLVRFRILIRDSMNASQTWATLHEEWAHALRMHLDQIGDSNSHDSIYAAIHGQIMSAYADEARRQIG